MLEAFLEPIHAYDNDGAVDEDRGAEAAHDVDSDLQTISEALGESS